MYNFSYHFKFEFIYVKSKPDQQNWPDLKLIDLMDWCTVQLYIHANDIVPIANSTQSVSNKSPLRDANATLTISLQVRWHSFNGSKNRSRDHHRCISKSHQTKKKERKKGLPFHFHISYPSVHLFRSSLSGRPRFSLLSQSLSFLLQYFL